MGGQLNLQRCWAALVALVLHADWVKEDCQVPMLGRGGEVAQFTPIGLNEIDGRQTVPGDRGVVMGCFQLIGGYSSGQNTKVLYTIPFRGKRTYLERGIAAG